jgi:hypothetical protein
MINSDQIIQQFYTAFQNKDYGTMQSLYHPNAKFSDPVFQNLSSEEVKAMWQMLLTSPAEVKIVFDSINTKDQSGSCHWEAWYNFSATNRKVHNIIDATFKFQDGKIIDHKDQFNFWRWSRMALGTPGLLMGWSPFLLNKVRATARKRLEKFMNK